MKKSFIAASIVLAAALAPLAVQAQNIAVVNGKPVPKSRVDTIVTQVQKDDPLIYLYRQRNLTAYSEDLTGVSTFADGVVRLSRAGFVEGGND